MAMLQQRKTSAGFSLMEVLITMLIILIGLLGIVALQGQAQVAELEAYQRAQALIMMSDIVDRLNTNRSTLNCFRITTDATDGTPFLGTAGTGHLGTPACAASTTAYNNLANSALTGIDNLLKGNSERISGVSVGAMIGARACISYDNTTELGGAPGTGLYTVIVTWQGMSNLNEPTQMCAKDLYGTEAQRRAISTTLRIADLF